MPIDMGYVKGIWHVNSIVWYQRYRIYTRLSILPLLIGPSHSITISTLFEGYKPGYFYVLVVNNYDIYYCAALAGTHLYSWVERGNQVCKHGHPSWTQTRNILLNQLGHSALFLYS